MNAQILTIDIANELKGKKISTVYHGYKGQDGFDVFTIGDIISEYDIAQNDINCDPKFANRAKYWESYMSDTQLEDKKNTMVLHTIEGRNTFIRSHSFNFGAFTCSDSDRFVYFQEC